MAKAIGVIGGYIASTQVIADAVRSFATGLIFTTSLPPAITAGCLASVEHLKASRFERVGIRGVCCEGGMRWSSPSSPCARRPRPTWPVWWNCVRICWTAPTPAIRVRRRRTLRAGGRPTAPG
nr:aminotransferase class I/II-fold pyridoxal phosphate-dependent enzyme [Pseudomonas alcaliphila]